MATEIEKEKAKEKDKELVHIIINRKTYEKLKILSIAGGFGAGSLEPVLEYLVTRAKDDGKFREKDESNV